MRLADRLRVEAIRASAPFTVRYGDHLRFAGQDLAAPRRIHVRTRHGRIPVHLYGPTGEARPVHVHLHGGAWLMRHPQMDDWWCRYLAATAGVVVANVDFEVAPRVTYPVAQHQAHDVAAALAADGAPVSVGGFSSGGGMAASVALQARDTGSFTPTLQVLGIPALDLSAEPRDGDRGMISPDLRRLVRRVYLPDPVTRREAYASPLLAADLAGLPPAVVLTAERDVLRAEGDAYAGRLSEAGVRVVHHVTPGVDHYFLTEDPVRARTTMAMVADEIAAAGRVGDQAAGAQPGSRPSRASSRSEAEASSGTGTASAQTPSE
ncbi:alpha/beta hydrolase fold domain-containing protein [Nocardioides hwasunensis]|uniref:Alpha/beta hydrolase fold domain-containing protein n=1 Tax=Nocardioides hwasunensis TaxID=397258 RepID=A0ABR8MMT0_9ACTN|nr:alpha/beta hydrolase fold domain-containing protein [Nocardioides hwasunensis]MBD3916117.1 alpha/beta hydrolase fold domain-containing protein [Nocardioides hwasunensis]